MRTVKSPQGRWLVLPVLSLVVMAASPPPKTYDLRFSSVVPGLSIPAAPVVARPPGTSFDIAPTPNRDVSAPTGPGASNETYLSPSVFSRGRQNRGEGFLSGSSAQGEQDRRALPGAGINLTMPLQK